MPTAAFVSHVQTRAGNSFTQVVNLRCGPLNGRAKHCPFMLTELHGCISSVDFAFNLSLSGERSAVVTRLLGEPRLP